MDIKKLQSIVIDALEDVKAQDIMLFDTVHLTSLFDRIVVASGTSNRQTKALAASVRDKVKAAGGDIISIEGEDTGEWVLVDLGDMIVHIMQGPIRAYYRLEEIWGDKEIKLGAAKRLVKRADSAETAKKPSRHLTVPGTSGPAIAVTEPDAPKARKPRATKAKAEDDAPAKKAVKKPATKTAAKTTTAVGKTVKVPVSKSTEAAVKATKAKPPKVTKPAVPAKTVIKRKTAKADE